MSDPRRHRDLSDGLAADLVEYFVVSVPALDALAGLVPAFVDLVESASIRLLDIVIVERDPDGVVAALELDDFDGMEPLRAMVGEATSLLSNHDIELAALALRPGNAGLVVVTEDRWATPLAIALQQAGGQIIGGERIPPARIESALADRDSDDKEDV
jgi:hypothetical protein